MDLEDWQMEDCKIQRKMSRTDRGSDLRMGFGEEQTIQID